MARQFTGRESRVVKVNFDRPSCSGSGTRFNRIRGPGDRKQMWLVLGIVLVVAIVMGYRESQMTPLNPKFEGSITISFKGKSLNPWLKKQFPGGASMMEIDESIGFPLDDHLSDNGLGICDGTGTDLEDGGLDLVFDLYRSEDLDETVIYMRRFLKDLGVPKDTVLTVIDDKLDTRMEKKVY